MAQETFLRDATLSQLTEALISKSDEVFVISSPDDLYTHV